MGTVHAYSVVNNPTSSVNTTSKRKKVLPVNVWPDDGTIISTSEPARLLLTG